MVYDINLDRRAPSDMSDTALQLQRMTASGLPKPEIYLGANDDTVRTVRTIRLFKPMSAVETTGITSCGLRCSYHRTL
jgi:hypothetical protein